MPDDQCAMRTMENGGTRELFRALQDFSRRSLARTAAGAALLAS
jgi:hypothetical protein